MRVVLLEANCKSLSLYDAPATTNILLNEFGDLICQCRGLLVSRPDIVVSYLKI